MSQETHTFQIATNITETYNAVNPEQPLLPGDPRYVDCAPWRGDEHIVNMIAQRIIRASAAKPVQYLANNCWPAIAAAANPLSCCC